MYSYENIRKTWNTAYIIVCQKVWIREFKANFQFFGLYMAWGFFLSRNYRSYLDHDLMANICEKGISVLAGNLNLGLGYHVTAV